MPDENAWLSVWAKSSRDDRGQVTHWLALHQHLDDAAAVAGRLVDRWVSPQVVSRIGRELPNGPSDVRVLACWLAAVHDVGKASPAFAVQVPKLADRMRPYGLSASPHLAKDPDRLQVRHERVGFLAVEAWLTELGLSATVAEQLASVVGSHHGVSPEDDQLHKLRRMSTLIGKGVWDQARRAILDRATTAAGGQGVLRAFRDVTLTKPALVLLTAIVIVADWIASSPDFFPLEPIATAEGPLDRPDDGATIRRLEQGWTRLGLPPRWSAKPLEPDLDEVFRQRFRRPVATARPVQVAAVHIAQAQPDPGMVIIEAPMGSGKTEAALLAAEVVAHASGADGCFVALPTQATSDAMFARVLRWLEVLPGRADGEAVTVNLAHGKAVLNDAFAGLVNDGRFVGVGEDAHEALVAHQWLSGRKKAALASFVVGTIDQVLFAGLKSRHLVLRHLALAGKVVIIDEVHAYDVYMSQYLDRVLEWLGAYRVPVVLLSATLPAGRRAELLRAYDTGRGSEGQVELEENLGYPVVLGSGGVPAYPVLPPMDTSVRVVRLADDLDTLVAYLRERLSAGGCVAVVRNTVTRVQETADRLVAEFGDEHVTVTHSRFLSCDRSRTDRELLRRFGPPGPGAERPRLHIVVGSQVLEQSLDIDFDLMVTDLAPIDLVLQRVGRLHRHDRVRPAPLRDARCAVVGVADWNAEPVVAVSGSRRVYGEHLLLRAAALLRDRDVIGLPADISPLVQQAYGNAPLGSAGWQPAMAAAQADDQARARRRVADAQSFLLGAANQGRRSLVGWDHAGVGEVTDDNHQGAAQVRDGAESLEVLVVQQDADGGLLTPTWIERGAGQQLPLDLAMSHDQAKIVAACGLRLPLALSHPGVVDDVIAALEPNQFASFRQSSLLNGQLVLVLGADRQARVRHGRADFRLTYDLRRGLIHERG